MVAPAFDYVAARSYDEAVRLLAESAGAGYEPKLLAGGQSLMPMLNLRLAHPELLIDINPADQRQPSVALSNSGGLLRLPALTRHRVLLEHDLIRQHCPLLAEAVRHVGNVRVRNRGTIGGSLAHGDPTGELPLASLVLGATVRVTGPSGRRDIPVAELYQGSYATVLEPDELLTEVVFPRSPPFFAFSEQCRRHNDFAVVSVAAVGDRGPDGTWSGVRIGLGGVADQPVLAAAAGAAVSGTRLADESIVNAAQAALDVVDPPSDVRASAEYRRHLVPVYVRRVLTALRSAGSA